MQKCNRLVHYLGCWDVKLLHIEVGLCPSGTTTVAMCLEPRQVTQGECARWEVLGGGRRQAFQTLLSVHLRLAHTSSSSRSPSGSERPSAPAFPFLTLHASWSVCNVQLSCVCLSGALLSAVVSLFNNDNGHLHITGKFINMFTQNLYY